MKLRHCSECCKVLDVKAVLKYLQYESASVSDFATNILVQKIFYQHNLLNILDRTANN